MPSCSKPIMVFQKSFGHAVLMPCGRCAECLDRKKQGWILRLQSELQNSAFSRRYFITLTYNDKFLSYESFSRVYKGVKQDYVCTGESLLNPYDLRKFIERFRSIHCSDFAYFACGEYGDTVNTHRPHFHIILFTNCNWQDTTKDVRLAWSKLIPETRHEKYLRELKAKKLGVKLRAVSRNAWSLSNRESFGRIDCQSVTYKRLSYVAKYVNKQLGDIEVVPPFYRCSKGLGLCWLNTPMAQSCKTANRHFTYLASGVPCAIPRYLSQKLFDLEDMKEFELQMIDLSSLPLDIPLGSERSKQWFEEQFRAEQLSRRRRLLAFHHVPLYC